MSQILAQLPNLSILAVYIEFDEGDGTRHYVATDWPCWLRACQLLKVSLRDRTYPYGIRYGKESYGSATCSVVNGVSGSLSVTPSTEKSGCDTCWESKKGEVLDWSWAKGPLFDWEKHLRRDKRWNFFNDGSVGDLKLLGGTFVIKGYVDLWGQW